MKALLPIILLLSLVAPAKADESSVLKRYESGTCGRLAEYYHAYANIVRDDPGNAERRAYFAGYIAGFHDGDNRTFFNIPAGTTYGQVAHVVGLWIQEHPDQWNLEGSQCVIKAIRAVWPKN